MPYSRRCLWTNIFCNVFGKVICFVDPWSEAAEKSSRIRSFWGVFKKRAAGLAGFLLKAGTRRFLVGWNLSFLGGFHGTPAEPPLKLSEEAKRKLIDAWDDRCPILILEVDLFREISWNLKHVFFFLWNLKHFPCMINPSIARPFAAWARDTGGKTCINPKKGKDVFP